MIHSLTIFAGVLLLAGVSICAGVYISRLPKIFWITGVLVGLGLILSVVSARKFPAIVIWEPFSFLTQGRREFLVLSVSSAFMFSILIPKLPRKRLKVLVGIVLGLGLFEFSVIPFLTPAFVIGKLSTLQTTIVDDVCIQSTHYTCGAACGVTALRRFGIEAEEGELAIESYTSRMAGTGCNLLGEAIEKLYVNQGISCEHVRFRTIDELEGQCPVIVTVKFALFVDHFVTVLEVADDYVMIGDPLQGRIKLSRKDFSEKWRNEGVVIRKEI